MSNKLTYFLALVLILISCKKEIVLFDGPAGQNYELPLLLNLDNEDCAYDSDLSILKYSIDQASLLNYNPLVTFQSYSEITFEGISLKNNDSNNLGNLELNKAYELVIKTKGETKIFTLQFTDIPIVQIVSNDPIVNGPKIVSRLVLNHPNKEKPSENNWIGIEHRGASSLKYDKKSFGFEVYSTNIKKTPISRPYFNFKSNCRWILNAQYADPSRLRNKVSFDLWKSVPGVHEHIAIESKFVEVFVNNKALGLYSFGENYSGPFLDLGSESVFYEGTDNSLITNFEAMPDEDPKSAFWADWEQKFIEPPRTIEWNDFESFSDLIVNGTDTEFKNDISGLIDLDNVIDYYLFVNLMNARDNVGKNLCFLKREPSSKFVIVPWDLDGTWGRSSFGIAEGHASIITNNLFKRLEDTNPENYNARVKNRWQELRLTTFSYSNLNTHFVSNFNTVSSYEIINFENTLWSQNLNLASEQSYIQSWLTSRLAYLDAHFS